MSVETVNACGFAGGYTKLITNMPIPKNVRRVSALSQEFKCFSAYDLIVRIDENGIPIYVDFLGPRTAGEPDYFDIPDDIPLSNPVANIIVNFWRDRGIYDTYCNNDLTIYLQDSAGNILKTINVNVMAYRSTITYGRPQTINVNVTGYGAEIRYGELRNGYIIKYDDYVSERIESIMLESLSGWMSYPGDALFPGIIYVREYDANDNLLRISKIEMYLPEIKPLPATRKIIVTSFAQGQMIFFSYGFTPYILSKCVG